MCCAADPAPKISLLNFVFEDRDLEAGAASTNSVSDLRGIGKIKFKAFDLGGHQMARLVWKDDYAKVDASVYLVDSADRDRFPESKKEMNALLADDLFAEVLFLILENKIDIPIAASEDELRQALGLASYTTGKGKASLGNSNIRPI